MATTLFQGIGGSLDNATATFVTGVVNHMIHTITPWALASVTLYITFYAFMLMTSRLQEPVWDGLLKCAKIMMISALALNADTYLTWVVGTLKGLQASLVLAVTGKEAATMYQALDNTLNDGMTLIAQCALKATDAGWSHMGTMINWYLVAGLCYLAFFWVVVMGGAAIVIASGLLKLVFAVGPLFIMALMFPATEKFFDRWLGKAMTYIFQIIMVGAMMAIAVRVLTEAVGMIDFSQQSEQNALLVALSLVSTGAMLYARTLKAADLAGDFGGAVAVGMLDAAGAAQATLAPMRAARNVVNPTSTRLDPTTGHRTTASRLEHIAMGRTVAVPAYRQVLLENMRNGWKKPPGGSIQPSSSAPAASSRPAPGSRQALLERLRSYGGQPPPRGDS